MILSKKIRYAAVRNFFTGKYAVEHDILQLPKGKKHIQQLTIPFTEQLQVRVLSASQDAVVKQVITAYLMCFVSGPAAQLAEQLTVSQKDVGSSPIRVVTALLVWYDIYSSKTSSVIRHLLQ